MFNDREITDKAALQSMGINVSVSAQGKREIKKATPVGVAFV